MNITAFHKLMAEAEGKGAASQFIILGVIVIQLAISFEMWWMISIGIIMFIIGVGKLAASKEQGFLTTTVQEINPYLPTSKGVDFLETVVGFADNPDTAQMAVGAQPAGTHPRMEGISSEEFAFLAQSFLAEANQGYFVRNSNAGDFMGDGYDEFVNHKHERILPLAMADPVANWHNPVDEWQNPTRYW